ncbi:hypothetical protein BpHYR1_043911 [Brachionus plicatilis]|uniref:Uncharacterized protein n=1 Tax=Brachionus plicatilis TaxID=10195 RepID=A0A3M7S9X6_BRAPC|nr:hypothetical protein BpHYR1_043911 [Brachionus plicatilis]
MIKKDDHSKSWPNKKIFKNYFNHPNNYDSDSSEISDFAVPLEASFNKFCCFVEGDFQHQQANVSKKIIDGMKVMLTIFVIHLQAIV